MAEGENIVQEGGKSLSHKLGPLPLWAWIVLGVGVTAAAYYFFIGKNANASSGGGSPILPELGGYNPYGSAGGSTTTPVSTVVTPATAAQIQSALSAAATALSLPLSEVQLYWQEAMSGQSPVGSSQATGAFSEVVNYVNTALGAGAPTPTAFQGVNANPFTSNTTWLNQILAFLPSGTAASDINNIIGWVNGTTTTLSQTASDALTSAQSIVGTAPNPLAYTIAPAAPAPNGTPSGGIANLTQAAINAWDNAYFTLPSAQQNFDAWVTSAPSSITQTFDTGTLSSIYNYFLTSAGQSAVKSAGGALNFFNNYYTNPSGTPLTAPPAPVPVLNSGPARA